MALSSPLAVGAVIFAFCGAAALGVCGVRLVRRRQMESKRRASLLGKGSSCAEGAGGRVIAYAQSCSRARSPGRVRGRASVFRVRNDELVRDLAQAGLAESVSCAGFATARVRMGVAGFALGLVAGALFSAELAFALALAGFALGWTAPRRAVRARKKERARELERHLPEMLEVVSLGLRSGLSFDRSLDVYGEHFDTLLARALASAKRRWTLGLASREEALRSLAGSYDSALFARCVEAVVRSLRYGSSLAESLEAIAVEARDAYRAVKQEQIAKAPVKMMVPTGALMLPAMLLLVLGPVLLELMGGF